MLLSSQKKWSNNCKLIIEITRALTVAKLGVYREAAHELSILRLICPFNFSVQLHIPTSLCVVYKYGCMLVTNTKEINPRHKVNWNAMYC